MADDTLMAQAGEFVLGTMEPAERAAFAARLAGDREAAQAVRDWERRLAPLASLVRPEAPPAGLWERIAGRAGAVSTVALSAPAAVDARLARRLRVWRAGAIAASLVAAALLAWIVISPAAIVAPREEPATVVVPAPAPEPAAPAPEPPPVERYLAAVHEEGEAPGLLLTVDAATGEIIAQPVELSAPAQRSLQLWWIAGDRAPRPIGLLDPENPERFTLEVDAALAGSTFAVSVEPEGGSPTGAPTGPITYTGQVVRVPGAGN